MGTPFHDACSRGPSRKYGSDIVSLCAVPLHTAVDGVLPAHEESAPRTEVSSDEFQRGREVRCPAQSVDRKHKIKVTWWNSWIHFHRRLNEADPRRKWTERLLRERDLNR